MKKFIRKLFDAIKYLHIANKQEIKHCNGQDVGDGTACNSNDERVADEAIEFDSGKPDESKLDVSISDAQASDAHVADVHKKLMKEIGFANNPYRLPQLESDYDSCSAEVTAENEERVIDVDGYNFAGNEFVDLLRGYSRKKLKRDFEIYLHDALSNEDYEEVVLQIKEDSYTGGFTQENMDFTLTIYRIFNHVKSVRIDALFDSYLKSFDTFEFTTIPGESFRLINTIFETDYFNDSDAALILDFFRALDKFHEQFMDSEDWRKLFYRTDQGFPEVSVGQCFDAEVSSGKEPRQSAHLNEIIGKYTSEAKLSGETDFEIQAGASIILCAIAGGFAILNNMTKATIYVLAAIAVFRFPVESSR